MRQLRIRDPMDLNEFIYCTADTDTEVKALIAKDLLSEVAEKEFLLTTQESKDFKDLELTREGVTNTHTDIRA
uniref:Uncharacterized protein n=1 Tax=Peronospora matthiolae TaxID=2874970 RepID=A0AAV1UFZ2_9STRA